MRHLGLLGCLAIGIAQGQQYIISTVAGGAAPPAPAAAVTASIGDPTRLAADAAGNIYFSSLHSVFKVDAAGTLTRVAGTARAGYSGDSGPALAAQLNFPMGLGFDAAGNLYVADRDASVVRKITPAGVISTVAGTGTAGYTGDAGPAVVARLNGPFGVAVDGAGNLYIADTGNEAVRKVTPDGVISTFAGTGDRGYIGDGGAARAAQLDGPEAVALDAAGNLYIADTFNGRIRRVAQDGTISTVAGTGSTGLFSGDGGPAKSAALSLPADIAVDRAGNLYVADFGNSRVRLVINGVIGTIAGSNKGVPPAELVAAVNVRLAGPTGLAVDASGAFYFVESGIGSGTGLAVPDSKIWKVSTAGILTTLAGSGTPSYSGDGAMAALAQLNGPTGLAVSAAGMLYVADTQNQRVRAFTLPVGAMATVAGNGAAGFNGEVSQPRGAQLNRPAGLAADAAGNWYVADSGNSRVRMVQPGGNLFTIAGNGNASYYGDGGLGTKGSVNQPQGVAADAAGNVYIADTRDHAVRKVTPNGAISTLAGNGNPGYAGDGGPASRARLNQPRGVAVDGSGNVYIADTGNSQIRRVDAQGIITTVDTGNSLTDPRAVAADTAGNLYIADTGNRRVRRVAAGGAVTTIAGTGQCCYAGDGGMALDALLNQPSAMAVDGNGNVFVADSANNSVRMLAPVSSAISLSSVANAASNAVGAVAPGEVVVVYGSGLAAVRSVLFNGVAGPVLFASSGQVGTVVPYALAASTGTARAGESGMGAVGPAFGAMGGNGGRRRADETAAAGGVQVVVQSATASSLPMAVAAAAVAPGLFTADGSGHGQAASVNQDGTQNSTAFPAAAGQVLSLYGTGEGQTTPAGVDGKVGVAPLPQPIAPVMVTIGGVAAEVRYAGGAPAQVAGVLQLNVVVPKGVSGTVPVVLTVAGVPSQAGVTVAVR